VWLVSTARLPNLLAALVVLMVAGCSSLLPSTTSITKSPWASYRDVQLTFDKIIPGKTTEAELKDLQLCPDSNPNITILNYSDILARFLPNPSLSLADLDGGVRDCVAAKTGCRGYTLNHKLTVKNREGNFFADILGFRRETLITGWAFSGLILVKGDVVVYKLTGGQPQIQEYEHVSSPLGPVMGIGQKLFGF
jgi:hypothetical protein